MLQLLRIVIAGLLIGAVVTGALAQTRGTAKKRTQTAPPATSSSSASNPYGLANCSERPFARDCDRRGTW
jgi:hypothetical protein